jgi:hypothetical protein
MALLDAHGTTSPPGRLLLHYYGHGSFAPSADSIFFFNDERSQYRGLQLVKVMNTCRCPLAFILDCPKAAAVCDRLTTGKDVFAFFACGATEELPISTHAPTDLFSSSLLMPYETATWWHTQRHSSLCDTPVLPSDSVSPFLRGFLNAILDAIAFETQPSTVYQAFTTDPALGALFRGFVLAQRVMLSFNIHSVTLPAVKPMASHPLWHVWDIAIDLCTTMADDAESTLFSLCMSTFEAYPSQGIYPIYLFFLTLPAFRAETSRQFFRLLDENERAAASAVRANLPAVITVLDKPDETVFLVIAKLQVWHDLIDPYSQMVGKFAMMKNAKLLRVGMLLMCITLSKGWVSSLAKLTQPCIELAEPCAPYSAILLGNLVERGGGIMGLHGYTANFIPLCAHEREDVRAAAVFLLGVSNDPGVMGVLDKMVGDPSPVVRQQLVHAYFDLAKREVDRRGNAQVEVFAMDANEIVARAYRSVKNAQAAGRAREAMDLNPMLRNLIASVKACGFGSRFATNLFDLPDLE